jgi:transposase
MEVSMAPKKYHVKLSAAQRDELEKLIHSGTIKVRVYKRARILLLADEAHRDGAKSDGQIAELVDVSGPTVHRIRRRFAQEGLEAALAERPRPGRVNKFTAKQRAEITALACSDPPEGHARWSLRLLADKLVELEIVESIHHDIVREVLKETNYSHTGSDTGVSAR